MSRKAMTEDYDGQDGWIARLRERWFGEVEDDGADLPPIAGPAVAAPRPAARRAPAANTLHLVQGNRGGQICKRVPRSLADAQRAAEDLKERRPVIVNLERADDELARRVIDFISGVTYALNGFYERVGDKVFLFTPSNIIIADEDDLEPASKGLFVGDEE